MEAIKNAIGLGSAEQQGREPVSGVSGSGTAGEPYDGGNAEDSSLGGKAPQQTDPAHDHTTSPMVGSTSAPVAMPDLSGGEHAGAPDNRSTSTGITPNVGSATTPSAPAENRDSVGGTHASSGDIAPGNTSGKSTDATTDLSSAEETTTEQPAKTGGIGSSSWMSTALPVGKGKDETAGTSEGSDPMHAHQEIPDSGTPVGAEPVGRTSGPPSHSLPGTHGSIAPEKPDHSNAPMKPAAKGTEYRGTNPDAIPVAGGKKIGEEAYTERKSVQAGATDSPSSSSLPATTSDSTTEANTARNASASGGAVDSEEGVGAQSNTGTTSEPGNEGKEDRAPSTTSGASESKEHKDSKDSKEKKHGLIEKIKDKVHHHKH